MVHLHQIFKDLQQVVSWPCKKPHSTLLGKLWSQLPQLTSSCTPPGLGHGLAYAAFQSTGSLFYQGVGPICSPHQHWYTYLPHLTDISPYMLSLPCAQVQVFPTQKGIFYGTIFQFFTVYASSNPCGATRNQRVGMTSYSHLPVLLALFQPI